MSTVRKSQTRNPFARALQRNLDTEEFHYLPIQRDTKDYISPLTSYLDAESPTNPGQPMYQIVADPKSCSDPTQAMKERALAGAPDNVLLRCSKADEQAVLRAVHDETIEKSRKKTKTVLTDREGREYESDEEVRGGILTGA